METMKQYGYLVLADISGYTSYVASTEIEHSQEVLAELLELIVDRFKTLLTLPSWKAMPSLRTSRRPAWHAPKPCWS